MPIGRTAIPVARDTSDLRIGRRGLLSTIMLSVSIRKHPAVWENSARDNDTNRPGQPFGGGRLAEQSPGREYASTPNVTIITVVYNGAATLERTVKSVLAQAHHGIEYVVIDGGSTDGTVPILEKYGDKIACWVSERDNGIYDAMNKGISLARGKWIYFLGADDFLSDENVIDSLALDREKEAQLVFGYVTDDRGNVFESRFGWRTLLHNTVHHQSAFYRAELFKDFRYSTVVPVVGDYELNLRIFTNRLKFRRVDRLIAVCASSGVSQSGSDYHNFLDYFLIRSRYMGYLKNGVLLGILLLSLVKRHAMSVLSR